MPAGLRKVGDIDCSRRSAAVRSNKERAKTSGWFFLALGALRKRSISKTVSSRDQFGFRSYSFRLSAPCSTRLSICCRLHAFLLRLSPQSPSPNLAFRLPCRLYTRKRVKTPTNPSKKGSLSPAHRLRLTVKIYRKPDARGQTICRAKRRLPVKHSNVAHLGLTTL